MGDVLRQAWNESKWTVLMGYLTISTNVRRSFLIQPYRLFVLKRDVKRQSTNQPNVRRYQTHHRWHFFLSGRQRTGALCVQHSPTAAALSTSFRLNHAPTIPVLNAVVTRFRESYSSVSRSRESKNWRNQAPSMVEFCNAQHLSECDFRVSRFAR